MKDIQSYKFLKKLAELSFIDEIWLFGSRGRGDNSERADIDLAIICPKASDSDWRCVLDIISNADTLLKIDCVRFDHLAKDDKLRENIVRFKKIIYSR